MTQIEKYIERLKTLQNLYEEGQPQHNAFGIAIVAANEMLVKNGSMAFVKERFSPMQKVEWDGTEYWVMEDNGEDKVLVANADETTHPEYDDWWVDRDKLNAL